ncbi:30S ribosomal protein S16 [Candidatus Woesebacteria bacterium]|nr:30S ribosomal protein S16 [Candidatus Woesebacteria bacterium]
MAVTLRLMRFGKKHRPYYRIVALDKRKKRDGAYKEKVGSYDPMKEPAEVLIDKAKYEYWTSKGAIISEGLRRLLKNKKNVTFT